MQYRFANSHNVFYYSIQLLDYTSIRPHIYTFIVIDDSVFVTILIKKFPVIPDVILDTFYMAKL